MPEDKKKSQINQNEINQNEINHRLDVKFIMGDFIPMRWQLIYRALKDVQNEEPGDAPSGRPDSIHKNLHSLSTGSKMLVLAVRFLVFDSWLGVLDKTGITLNRDLYLLFSKLENTKEDLKFDDLINLPERWISMGNSFMCCFEQHSNLFLSGLMAAALAVKFIAWDSWLGVSDTIGLSFFRGSSFDSNIDKGRRKLKDISEVLSENFIPDRMRDSGKDSLPLKVLKFFLIPLDFFGITNPYESKSHSIPLMSALDKRIASGQTEKMRISKGVFFNLPIWGKRKYLENLKKDYRKLEEVFKIGGKDLDNFFKMDQVLTKTSGHLINKGYSLDELIKMGCPPEHLQKAGFTNDDILACKNLTNIEKILAINQIGGESKKMINQSINTSATRSINDIDELALHLASESAVFKRSEGALKGFKSLCQKTKLHTVEIFTEFKKNGVPVENLIGAGYSLSDFKGAGFTRKDFTDARYFADQLKGAGFSARELKEAGYSVTDLTGAGSSVVGYKGAGFSASDLILAGFSTGDLISNGYKKRDINDALSVLIDLQSVAVVANEEAKKVKDPPVRETKEISGYEVKIEFSEGGKASITVAGYSEDAIKKGLIGAGYSARELKDFGFSAGELINADFHGGQLRDAGFSAEDFKNAKLSAVQAIAAGFSGGELKDGGFTEDDLIEGGFTAEELKAPRGRQSPLCAATAAAAAAADAAANKATAAAAAAAAAAPAPDTSKARTSSSAG